jgi:tetratricopeptide (TPR) repeat protein/tRNA A-37 threonylcarbamoyl transferase component Bud32
LSCGLLLPQQKVGRFIIRRKVGEGVFGRVYEADDPTLKRTVAVKVAKAEQLTNSQRVQRFLREAQAVARLTHSNIVTVYESGRDGNRYFIASAFIRGRPLADEMSELHQQGRTMDIRRAVEIVRKLAEAMAYAHRNGVIHRDVKPANMMLREDGEPLLMDFGLAAVGDEEIRLTQEGRAMGTPPYMAPEQWKGKAEAASDQYSLGCLLFELLAGQWPFIGGTSEHFRFLHESHPIPSPRKFRSGIPRDIETICLTCLAKAPSERYANCQELADDLRRWLENEPIRKRPMPPWERLVRWARREPLQVALLVAGLVAVVVTLFYFRAEALRSQFEAKVFRAEQNRALRENNALRSWDQGKEAEDAAEKARAGKRESDAVELFTKAASCYEKALDGLEANRPEEDLSGESLLAQIHERLARVKRELAEGTSRQRAQAANEQFLKDSTAIGFYSLNVSGDGPEGQRRRIGKLASAALARVNLPTASPQEAVQGLEACRSRTPDQFGPVATGCYEVLLSWAEAEAGFASELKLEEQKARAERALGLLAVADAVGVAAGIPPTQTFHHRRARYRTQAGDPSGAAADRARAGELPARTALDHLLVALDAYKQGQLSQVDAACEEVLRLQPGHFWAHYLQSLGQLKNRRWSEAKAGLLACLNTQADFPWPYISLASARIELGKLAEGQKEGRTSAREFGEAQKDYDTALRLLDGEDRLGRYVVLTNRATLWIHLEQAEKARADLEQAIGLQPELPAAHVNLGELHRRRKEWDAAIRALDRAVQCRPDLPALYHTRARIYLERNDLASARRDFQFTIDREPKGSKSERLTSVLVELGYLKHRNKEFAAALADFDAALRINENYLPALSQRAGTLLLLNRYAEAGRTLDRYLVHEKNDFEVYKKNDFEVYKVRGLIHARLGEPGQAIKAYTQALQIENDRDVQKRRGWTYLSSGAAQLALDDFEAVLGQDSSHSEALCGRGQARARLGKLEEAVADVEQAVRTGQLTAPLLLGAASVHARVAGGQPGQPAPRGTRNIERAVELIAEAMRQVRPEEQPAFWEQHVRKEPAFAPLWGNHKMTQLARLYAR